MPREASNLISVSGALLLLAVLAAFLITAVNAWDAVFDEPIAYFGSVIFTGVACGYAAFAALSAFGASGLKRVYFIGLAFLSFAVFSGFAMGFSRWSNVGVWVQVLGTIVAIAMLLSAGISRGRTEKIEGRFIELGNGVLGVFIFILFAVALSVKWAEYLPAFVSQGGVFQQAADDAGRIAVVLLALVSLLYARIYAETRNSIALLTFTGMVCFFMAAVFFSWTSALFTGAYWAFRFFECLGFAAVFTAFLGVHFNIQVLKRV